MGAPKQLGLTCHTSSPGFIVSKMLEGLWWKTYLLTGFQNKHCLILVTEWKVWKYFQSLNTSNMYLSLYIYRLVYFKFHHMCSDRWRYLKGFPQDSKQHHSSSALTFISAEQSILLSGCLIHVSFKITSFSGESQRPISIVIECTLQAHYRCFFSFALNLYGQSNSYVPRMSVSKVDKQKQTQAWSGATLVFLILL